MLKNKSLKKILLLLIVISMLPVFYTSWQRIEVEKTAKQVEIVIDTEEIYLTAMGLGSREDYLDALSRFKEAGATTATLYQKTFKLLQERGDLTVLDFQEAINLNRLNPENSLVKLLGRDIQSFHHYIFSDDLDLFGQINSSLAQQIEVLNWQTYQNENFGLIEMPSAHFDLFETAGLFYDLAELKEYLDLGFLVQLRPADTPGLDAEAFERIYSPLLEARDSITGVIVTGTNLPGTQDFWGKTPSYTMDSTAFSAFCKLLTEQKWYYGLVETMTQLSSLRLTGDAPLLQRLDFQSVRVYSIQRAELDKPDWLSAKGIEERWLRGAVDRNMRVVYLRLFENRLKDPIQIIDLNTSIVANGRAALNSAGFSLGAPSVLPSFHLVGQAIFLPIALFLSAILFLLIWFEQVEKPLIWLSLLILAVLGAGAFGYLSRSNGAVGGSWVNVRQLLALGAQVLYPVLAAAFLLQALDRQKENNSVWKLGLKGVTLAFFSYLIVLAGGLIVGTILADNAFMLELQYFRGVKLGFLLPLLIIALYYFYRHGFVFKSFKAEGNWARMQDEVRRLFKSTITVEMAFFTLLAGAALFYYILRSGNASVAMISSFELKMRTFLERVLTARPRNKEFLIGYPAIVLMPYLANSSKRFLVGPFLALATMGFVSVVNTFAHVRSPLLISLNRGVWGLVLGIIIGLIALFVFHLIVSLVKKVFKEA